MKSKNAKGFTLIECIVSMAILAIGTLIMAQIYGSICKINEVNHRTNESLSSTVLKAETKDCVGSTGNTYYKALSSGDNVNITFTKDSSTGTSYHCVYTMPTTIYVLYSEDTDSYGNQTYQDPDDDPLGLRYKYFASNN